jgi:uncharacterized membrane protein HdeD (DUF308 family)
MTGSSPVEETMEDWNNYSRRLILAARVAVWTMILGGIALLGVGVCTVLWEKTTTTFVICLWLGLFLLVYGLLGLSNLEQARREDEANSEYESH